MDQRSRKLELIQLKNLTFFFHTALMKCPAYAGIHKQGENFGLTQTDRGDSPRV